MCIRDSAKAVGQPAAIGGPVHAGDGAPFAAVDVRHLTAFQVDDQQFLAMIAQGDFIFGRGRLERHGPPDVQPVSYTHLDVYKRQQYHCVFYELFLGVG